ncbi:MAG: DUF4342 domain-containing protein [Gemmatimonadaceae bacterium]|nr:DUF4342 domain-containing protein [Gemmatimonadaceae bacterium]
MSNAHSTDGHTRSEVTMDEIKVAGDKLKSTLKQLIREGNVRRIIVRNATGRTLIDMPLSAGLAGAFLAPFWAAVAGIVALTKEFTIVVERDPDTRVTKVE